MPFLPITRENEDEVFDFVMISADAYVDHPSFGHAIISRIVEDEGFTIGIIPQPQKDADYMRLGCPKYGFLVSGGVVDSMVDNYTVAKIRRDRDEYSPGGKAGLRPDRAVTVYSRALKRLFAGVPVLIGGIEASLRRFAHYDYWADKVMPSILIDSKADLLMFGMGERTMREILALVHKGIPLSGIKDVRGTAYYVPSFEKLSTKMKERFTDGTVSFCPTFEEVCEDKKMYVKAFNVQHRNADPLNGKTVVQKHGGGYVIQNQGSLPMTPPDLDRVYALPYMRAWHPSYKEGVPALSEVKFSITSVRGCFGGCSYCALTYNQGRIVQKRSKESIVEEAQKFVTEPDFKGYIHDVGGPTANFRDPACAKQEKCGACKDRNCIGYERCANLRIDHREYVDILRALRQIDGVKKVFIRSGIRFDYLMCDEREDFFKELVKYHVSGQLKVAPEHCVDSVLKLMNKPPFAEYLAFKKRFDDYTKKIGMEQFLVPYLISSHPGCTLADAVKLAEYLKSINYMPEQVQDFYPTPSTKSTCMYYTGIDPDSGEEVYVPRTRGEKALQRALLQYRRPENRQKVMDALIRSGREDLIGYGKECLIVPDRLPKTGQAVNRRPKEGNDSSSDKTKDVRRNGAYDKHSERNTAQEYGNKDGSGKYNRNGKKDFSGENGRTTGKTAAKESGARFSSSPKNRSESVNGKNGARGSGQSGAPNTRGRTDYGTNSRKTGNSVRNGSETKPYGRNSSKDKKKIRPLTT